MFITFEGIEGSGKSTQIRLLAEALTKNGHEVVLTREPGGTPIGDEIRQILLHAKNSNMVSDCEQLLYWAARAQHIHEVIKPALDSGKVILCDRYVDSTIAYQGYGRGLPLDWLTLLKENVTRGVMPEKTIWLDLPVEEGLKRARGRIAKIANHENKEDRFENEDIAFHQRVQQGFGELAKAEPNRYLKFDVTKSKHVVHEEVLQKIVEVLN